LEPTFLGFFTLWEGRTSDHILLAEIYAYVRLFDVPDPARFTELVLAADKAVWDAKKDVEEVKEKLNPAKE